MASKSGGGAGFNPDGWQEGGGLIGNVDVKWTGMTVQKGYKDGSAPDATVVKVEMEAEGEGHEEYYSLGSKCEPDEDGKGIAKGGVITKSCKFAQLLQSLIDSGFPKDKIQNDVGVFEGLEAHMVREEVPDRPGLTRTPRADGRVYKETILIVDKIHKLPWEKAGKKAGGKKEEGEGGVSDLEQKATDAVMEVLEKNPKGADPKKVLSDAYQVLKADPDRNEVLKMLREDEYAFLKNGALWTWDEKKKMVVA